SHAVLIRTPLDLPAAKHEWVQRLLMRIDGVQQVRESKYIMLHAPRSALPEIRRLLPGSESPTIIPLEGFADRVAVHAVCRENVFWETLESLKRVRAGATGARARPDRRPGAGTRQRARVPRRPDAAAARAGHRARGAVRAAPATPERRGTVHTRGQRAPALGGDHAGGAGAHRRLSY